jgi:hypothetical protein
MRQAHPLINALGIIICLLGTVGSSLAQTPVNVIKAGTVVRVQSDKIPLREKPRGQVFLTFRGPGKQIATLKKNDCLRVKWVETVTDSLGAQRWAFVERAGQPSEGWIFLGAPGDKDSPYVEQSQNQWPQCR